MRFCLWKTPRWFRCEWTSAGGAPPNSIVAAGLGLRERAVEWEIPLYAGKTVSLGMTPVVGMAPIVGMTLVVGMTGSRDDPGSSSR